MLVNFASNKEYKHVSSIGSPSAYNFTKVSQNTLYLTKRYLFKQKQLQTSSFMGTAQTMHDYILLKKNIFYLICLSQYLSIFLI